jgi:hypothetical protein
MDEVTALRKQFAADLKYILDRVTPAQREHFVEELKLDEFYFLAK